MYRLESRLRKRSLNPMAGILNKDYIFESISLSKINNKNYNFVWHWIIIKLRGDFIYISQFQLRNTISLFTFLQQNFLQNEISSNKISINISREGVNFTYH